MALQFRRMAIEVESPEESPGGYEAIKYNLAESSCRDRSLELLKADIGLHVDVSQLILQYGDHKGHPKLRKLLADEMAGDPGQVLLSTGAAGALFIVHSSLLKARDHVVVVRPNYSCNVETPRAIGCDVTFLELSHETGWKFTLAQLTAALRPETKLVSITVPHNPTGTVLTASEVKEIAALLQPRNVRLLVDETYRDLLPAGKTPGLWAASIAPHVISVGSMSKAYGLPGLRVGWLLCRDPALVELFLAAKEQIQLCGPIIEEEIAYQVYAKRPVLLPKIQAEVSRGLDSVRACMQQHPTLFEWVEPSGGVVCFPRLRPEIDTERFYALLAQRGVVVGPGHWFERERRHMRVGFGWPLPEELKQGLVILTECAQAARAGGK